MIADGEAYAELVRRYGPDLLAFIRFYTRTPHEAEDLTQETLLRAYRHFAEVRSADAAKSWLFRIAVNTCKDYFRRQRRRPLQYVADPPDCGTSESAEDKALSGMASRRLVQQVLQLPMNYKAPVLLHYFQGMSLREVAITLGTTEGAVKSRLHRARTMIRREGGEVQDESSSHFSG